MPGRGVRYHFLVCTNLRPADSPLPCCALRGSAAVYQAFVRALAARRYPAGVKVTATSCLTPCQCGPTVVVYPEDTWYAGVTPEDVPEIIAAHLDQGRSVDRLRLPEGVRI